MNSKMKFIDVMKETNYEKYLSNISDKKDQRFLDAIFNITFPSIYEQAQGDEFSLFYSLQNLIEVASAKTIKEISLSEHYIWTCYPEITTCLLEYLELTKSNENKEDLYEMLLCVLLGMNTNMYIDAIKKGYVHY